ncbi:antibiotic biosynthesis monooxygenase family protein [Thermoflavimicrobium dichotomicum]|nr:antibiotic biosynthesis monooxygenase family protein [Thermoflavimicrobium dichotomicum]
MYLVQNRLPVESEEQLTRLKERFSKAPESMKQVPGFISFRLLQAEDHSHLIAETVFQSKEDFLNWLESDHFKRAHGGKGGERKNANINNYMVIIS